MISVQAVASGAEWLSAYPVFNPKLSDAGVRWLRAALSREAAFRQTGASCRTVSPGRGCRLPLLHRVRSEAAKRAAGDEMTLNVERVVNGGVNGKEALGRSG
jgi:hypothetical protein